MLILGVSSTECAELQCSEGSPIFLLAKNTWPPFLQEEEDRPFGSVSVGIGSISSLDVPEDLPEAGGDLLFLHLLGV